MKREIVARTHKKSLSRFLGFFCIGFLIGIMIGNFLFPQVGGEAGIMSDYFLDKFEYMEIEWVSLFAYILEKRMKIYLILVISGVTVCGCLIAYGYTTWLGVSTGVFMSVCILRMGVIGILVGVLSILPQYLIYVPIYVFLVWRMKENQEWIVNCTSKKEKAPVKVPLFFFTSRFIPLPRNGVAHAPGNHKTRSVSGEHPHAAKQE